MPETALLEKINALPPESLGEVEDYVDFLLIQKQRQAQARAALQAEIADFATRYGGTELDFDPELEAAAAEHILATTKYDL